jgi:dihydroxyacid dehydratase/phosphogluconate dehydratase
MLSSLMVCPTLLLATNDLYNMSAGAFAVGKISDEERFDVVRHACPGAGACGGMYTANTMSSALEVSFTNVV